MGNVQNLPKLRPGDWEGVNRNFKKLFSSLRLGPDAVPTFAGLTELNYIQWDLTPTVSGPAEGLMYWNIDDGTLNLGMPGGSVNWQAGQEVLVRCRNTTGSTIINGAAVTISGASGGKPLIILADADNVSSGLTGLATEEISNNSNGYINIKGMVRDFDTSSWAPGTFLFLNSGGGLTNIPVTGNKRNAFAGTVVVQGSENGSVLLQPQNSPFLAGLSGVDIVSVADKDILQYNSSTSVWENSDALNTITGAFNGSFIETIDFTVAEAGGTVTGSLQQDSGGDLTQQFSDGQTTLDTTPALTVDLTAYVGTDSVPKEVFVYMLQSDKSTIAASNTEWPATEHIKIANLVLRSAVTTGTDGGALVNRNWNDHTTGTNNMGHLVHMAERMRQEPSQWADGVAMSLKNAGGTELTTGNSSTAVELVTSEGNIYQLHKQTFPAYDMYVNAADDAHVVNDSVSPYLTTADLVTDITALSTGVAIGVNKYFNLVVWGIQNRTGEAQHVMVNLPTGQYTTEANAISDADGYAVYDIPSAYKGKGFLIARLTFRLIAGSQWTYVAQEDLRGQTPATSAGVGVTTTDHSLLSNLGVDDHTQYHTDARAATWLAANHETTYAHANIALNTTHRGVTTGNPHSVAFSDLGVDHGDIGGLSDDDHTQYHTDARAATWLAANHETTYNHGQYDTAYTHSQVSSGNPHSVAFGDLGVDHGDIGGLTDDDHTQYLLIDGTRNMTGKLYTPQIVVGDDVAADNELLVADIGGSAVMGMTVFSTTLTQYGQMHFRKSHSDTEALAETLNTEEIGALFFYGVNTSSTEDYGARIRVQQIGDSAASEVPMDMTFYVGDGTSVTRRIQLLGAGDMYLNQEAQGNILCFGSLDVADVSQGAEFQVWRRAAEGDSHLDLFGSGQGNLIIDATGGKLQIRTQSTNNLELLDDANANIYCFNNGTIGDASAGKELRVYRTAAEGTTYLRLYNDSSGNSVIANNANSIYLSAAAGSLYLNNGAAGGVYCFSDAADGEYPAFRVYHYPTGTAKTYLGIRGSSATSGRFIVENATELAINMILDVSNIDTLSSDKLELQPSAQGDVRLFGVGDIGGGTGRSFYLYKINIAGGSSYLRTYGSSTGKMITISDGGLRVFRGSGYDMEFIDQADSDCKFFSGAASGETPALRIYGRASGGTQGNMSMANGVDADRRFNFDGAEIDYSYFNHSLGVEDNANIFMNIDAYSSTDAISGFLQFRKSHTTTIGNIQQTTTAEVLGNISFWGAASGVRIEGASIQAYQIGAASTYIPIDLEFRTSSASGGLARQMVIDDSGNVLVGQGTGLYHKFNVEGSVGMKEQSAADSSVGGWGHLWVKSGATQQLWFTDDAGLDTQLV